jgi:hypothetical protein
MKGKVKRRGEAQVDFFYAGEGSCPWLFRVRLFASIRIHDAKRLYI